MRASASSLKARAVVYTRTGGPEVATVATRDVRAPRTGEVRIKVSAAAVSPTDILLRDPTRPLAYIPSTPGMDAAGIVEAVGPGVLRLAPGDAVMAALLPIRPEGGGQAEYVVVPAASAVKIPEGFSTIEASTLPMNGLTALYALAIADLDPGQTLAVTGGAGYLASLVIPLAHQRGLRVIADARADEIDKVRAGGAEVVERSDDFAAALRRIAPEGADALLDTALIAEPAFAALRDGGTYIPVRGWQNPENAKRIVIKPVMVPNVLERTDWLEEIALAAQQGIIRPVVHATYAPENVADAQRAVQAGGMRGRPVIVF